MALSHYHLAAKNRRKPAHRNVPDRKGELEMGKVLGIDLGTTNSAMAVLEGGEPTIIINSEGDRTTPSVVAFRKDGERVVGKSAKNQAVTNPENTIKSIKRFIGRKFEETESERKTVAYEVVKGKDGRVEIDVEGKAFTPEEISAMVLQKLKGDAEKYLGETITQAVITVPAYFNDSQRQATKDAGRIAGLEVLRIINEPTAAALAYGLDKGSESETILVFDLGGGTFDVSILELGEGVFEVKSTNGDNHLGGDDWDQKVIDWLADKFKSDSGIDLRADKMALQRLKEKAEQAKIELSQAQAVQINLPFITADASGPKHLDYELTRAEFLKVTSDLLDRVKKPVESGSVPSRPRTVRKVVTIGSYELAVDIDRDRAAAVGLPAAQIVAVELNEHPGGIPGIGVVQRRDAPASPGRTPRPFERLLPEQAFLWSAFTEVT